MGGVCVCGCTQGPLSLQMLATKYYLSLNIESTGDRYHNTVNAIGIYWAPVIPGTPGPVIKKRWCLKPLPGDQDDPTTMREFWDKFPDVFQTIQAEARPAAEVMLEFRDFLRTGTQARGVKNTTILTDCPDFDLGRLDYLGQLRTGAFDRPVRYMDVGVRHGQADPSERLEQLGAGAEAKFEAWLKEKAPGVKHTHLPDDDAEHSYWQQVYCDEQRRLAEAHA